METFYEREVKVHELTGHSIFIKKHFFGDFRGNRWNTLTIFSYQEYKSVELIERPSKMFRKKRTDE